MAVIYDKFELPSKIKRKDSSKTKTFASFVAEPFERGFGHTVGNALRRIMLSSLETPAIISVRIEGIPHEYTAAEGIKEDMTHIVLNLKGALFRKLPKSNESNPKETKLFTKDVEVTQEQIDNSNGEYSVTLRDFVDAEGFELINPDHHIFKATKPMKRRVDLRIAQGRGYVPSERHELVNKLVNEIPVDAIFSPIRLVNYYVENTRVGKETDFDRLIIEITTDGRITPEEALSFASQIGIFHMKIFEEVDIEEIAFEQIEEQIDSDRDALMGKLALKINEIELSVRSTNCLQGANIDTIAELVIMPESEMLKFRNFGKKSLTEIRAKLEEMGLSLGMDLSKYGITRDNVKELVTNYQIEKAGSEL